MTRDAYYLARLLVAIAACCLLALALWPETRCAGCGADINRDRAFLGIGR
jgi:hypothetical protein